MSSFYQKPLETKSKLREFSVGAPDDMSTMSQEELPMSDFNSHSAPPTVLQRPMAPGYELSPAEREELQRYRQKVASKEAKVSDHAKKRVEILANIGRLNKDVMIDGVLFSLRTLKSKEANETLMSVVSCANDVEASIEIRRQTLARAIYKIDEQDVDLALGGSDFYLKLNLVDNMEDAIINKLYNEFTILRQEARTKYGLQTEAEVKGVVEDIKK